jgi:hypothetical protein
MNNQSCSECEYVFNAQLREEQRRDNLKASGQKFKIWLDELQNSGHWLAKIGSVAVRIVWVSYTAMLTIIIYFVALFSG